MDSAVAGLIGAAVGAVSGFAGTLLTSWISLTKEREQSKRNTRIEKDQWLRDRLQEIYGNCLYYLSKVLMASDISIDQGKAVAILSKEHQRNLFLDYSDAQRWLAMLLVYHPSRGSSEYSMLCHHIEQFSSNQIPNLAAVTPLRDMIINLAAGDTRLHNDFFSISKKR